MENPQKERLAEELDRLKGAYKKEKAKLEWAENDFEESLVYEAMEELKRRIKEVRSRLEEEENDASA